MALPQPKTPFSADDFLAWDATQTERHEFVRGEVFAMAGGEDRHASVSGNLFASYRLCPTLAEYAVVDIDRRAVDLFRKNAEGLWVLHPLVGNATLTLASVDHALALGELFADLEGDDASLRL